MKVSLKQYEAALSDFDMAIKLNAGKKLPALGYYERGFAKYCLGKYESSISDFDAEIKQNANNAEAYYYRGLAKAALDRIDEAEQDWRSALKFVPKEGDVQLKNKIERLLNNLK